MIDIYNYVTIRSKFETQIKIIIKEQMLSGKYEEFEDINLDNIDTVKIRDIEVCYRAYQRNIKEKEELRVFFDYLTPNFEYPDPHDRHWDGWESYSIPIVYFERIMIKCYT